MGYTLTDNLDIVQVGESFANANADTYISGRISSGTVADVRSGIRTTNYELPDFDNGLQKGFLSNWEPGDAVPDEAQMKSSPKSFTPYGKSTRVITRPAERPVKHRFADLEGNIVPVLLAQLYQGVDKEVIAFLLDAANFDQATFEGTNKLDKFGADQTPLYDIMSKAIQPLRKYVGSMPHLQMSMYLSADVMDVFSAHWNINPSGAGAGSGTTAGLAGGFGYTPHDAVAALFRANLRLDEVKVFDAISDTAARGATSSPAVQSTGLCWIGVTDSRMGWDLSNINNAGNISPDGALQLAWGRKPVVKSWIKEGSEVESFAGRCSFDIKNPRGQSWGKLFPSSEIFT